MKNSDHLEPESASENNVIAITEENDNDSDITVTHKQNRKYTDKEKEEETNEFWKSPMDEYNPFYAVFDLIRYFDAFGKPVSLNFKGREKFKTIPGALYTALAIWVVVNFAIFRSDYYSNIPLTWSKSEHNTLMKGSDIDKYIDIRDEKISLNLEIVPNAFTSNGAGERRYENNVAKVFNYTSIGTYNFKRDKSMKIKYFGGEINNPLNSGMNYNKLTEK